MCGRSDTVFYNRVFHEDKSERRKTLNTAVSLLSAVLVLCGVAAVTVGDAPLLPYISSATDTETMRNVCLPLYMPFTRSLPEFGLFPYAGLSGDTAGISGSKDTEIPDDALPVLALTLKPSESMDGEDGVYINNEANKDYDLRKLLNSDETTSLVRDGSVQVLIYHTHGTESYNTDGLPYYGDEYYEVHSEDTSQNVVHIGEIITEYLEERGIGVIHDETMYDIDGYNDAYERSCAAATKILEEYPGIKLILDIHRDTVIISDGTKYRLVTESDDDTVAQIMILVGTGKESAPNDHWIKNLALAVKLQRRAEYICDGLMRPVLLRNSGYNQHISEGALLVEIGTCGNTLKEAETAAELFASAILKELTS